MRGRAIEVIGEPSAMLMSEPSIAARREWIDPVKYSAGLAKSEERQNDPDHDDQADDINDSIHCKLLSFTARGTMEHHEDGSSAP